jgi:hypothetical protein
VPPKNEVSGETLAEVGTNGGAGVNVKASWGFLGWRDPLPATQVSYKYYKMLRTRNVSDFGAFWIWEYFAETLSVKHP